jgi:hypothetical protein
MQALDHRMLAPEAFDLIVQLVEGGGEQVVQPP